MSSFARTYTKFTSRKLNATSRHITMLFNICVATGECICSGKKYNRTLYYEIYRKNAFKVSIKLTWTYTNNFATRIWEWLIIFVLNDNMKRIEKMVSWILDLESAAERNQHFLMLSNTQYKILQIWSTHMTSLAIKIDQPHNRETGSPIISCIIIIIIENVIRTQSTNYRTKGKRYNTKNEMRNIHNEKNEKILGATKEFRCFTGISSSKSLKR